MPESRRRDRAARRTSDRTDDPSTARAAPRTRPDACPGAWRRHDAADGALLLPPALRQLVFETDVAAVDTLRVLPLL